MTEAVPLLAAWWRLCPALALQGALVVAAALLLDRLLPARVSPAVRLTLWGLACARFVLPPSVASPWSVASVLAGGFRDVATLAVWEEGASPWWVLALPAVWLGGALLLVLLGAVRAVSASRALARERQDAGAEIAEEARRAAALLGLARVPAVWSLPRTRSPFVRGLFRPEVYLPHGLGASELPHVLLHELAHVVRRDAWVLSLLSVVQVLHWYHPAFWIARRRVALLLEASCDRRAARALRGVTDGYRATLLSVASRMLAPAPGALAFLSPAAGLRLRVRALEDVDRPWRSRLLSAALAALLAVGLLPMGARAERASAEVAERIVRPPGCLQLRFLVLSRLAARDRGEAPAGPSR